MMELLEKCLSRYYKLMVPSGAFGFYKGFISNTERQHAGGGRYRWIIKDSLVVERLGNGLVNGFYTAWLFPIEAGRILGRLEIEISGRDRYSNEYSSYYKEWTGLYDLPPRE